MIQPDGFPACAVVIVTHNSQRVLLKCLKSVFNQSRVPSQVIVVDSGSEDTLYLKDCEKQFSLTLHLGNTNIGFCQANNIGMSYVEEHADYVLFLNPDAFLSSGFIEESMAHLAHPSAKNVGALTGLLLGYDIDSDQPSGLIDSTGVFQTQLGRWFDRGQGEKCFPFLPEYSRAEFIPAICGALMFCRYQALKQVELSQNEIMDSSFFMYKEDIDLSLRLRKRGWELLYIPELIAYHCRGWNGDRSKMSRKFRLMSAKNEMTLNARHHSPYYAYAFLKYLIVKYLNY